MHESRTWTLNTPFKSIFYDINTKLMLIAQLTPQPSAQNQHGSQNLKKKTRVGAGE